MPRRKFAISEGVKQNLLNCSFENLVVTWLMQDDCQVFTPILDHGHRTDVLIFDSEQYFCLQVKTVDGVKGKKQEVENRWQDCKIDFVIYFARNGEWGYIAAAFNEKKKVLNAPNTKVFLLKKSEFLTAFHTVDLS